MAHLSRRLLRTFLLVTALSSSAPAADSRAAFLRLLDRPRVALSPEASAPVESNGLAQIAFTFAADAEQWVPGLMVKTVPSSGRRPVVISLHGTGGNKESQIKLLTTLAEAGFIGVAIDGRYHGARAKQAGTADYNTAIFRAYQTGHEHPFFFDTAWDVIRLIDYLQTRDDVDPARIGLIGFSKGGIEAYLAAAADPRIAVVVPCIGVQSFRWAIDHGTWGSRIETIQSAFDLAAREARVDAPDAAFVRAFYDRVAPGIYGEFDGPAMLPLIAPRPLLVINGENDARTPLPGLRECTEPTRAVYRSLGAEEKFVLLVQPKTGHTVTPASLQTAQAWFVQWLKP